MADCYECGRDTIVEGYVLRVVNPSFQTLFVTPCIVEAIKYMESGGFCSTECYKIEVMKYAG